MKESKKLSDKQQFIRFLMSKGALKKFYKNIQLLESNPTNFWRAPKSEWINNAFIWAYSKEKEKYWWKLHRKWTIFCTHNRQY